MIKQKRGMATWMWILIVLILISVGVGLYFLLSGADGGSSLLGGGGSIPQPPALPN